jgi:hypothetical protein
MKRLITALIAAGLSAHAFAAAVPLTTPIITVTPQPISKPLEVSTPLEVKSVAISPEAPQVNFPVEQSLAETANGTVNESADDQKAEATPEATAASTLASSEAPSVSPAEQPAKVAEETSEYMFEISVTDKEGNNTYATRTILKSPVATSYGDTPMLAFTTKDGVNTTNSDGNVACSWKSSDGQGETLDYSTSKKLGEKTTVTLLPISESADEVEVMYSLDWTNSQAKRIIKLSDTCMIIDGDMQSLSKSGVAKMSFDKPFTQVMTTGTIFSIKPIKIK